MPQPFPAAANFKLWELDQTSDECVAKLIYRVRKAYGRIDLLVLNAGESSVLLV